MSFIIAGLDPALSNFGMVKGELDLSNGDFILQHLELTKSESTKTKQVRKNSDDLERARMLFKGMESFLEDVDLVCVEIPVGSQTARAMASYGVCVGILASIEIPMIQLTANEVKLAGAGIKNATKQQMIDWATKTYPQAKWLTKKFKGETKYIADNEHLADALAAIYAGVKTDVFKQQLSFFKGKNK